MLPLLARTILRSKDFFSSAGSGSPSGSPSPPSTISSSLSPEQLEELRGRLQEKGFEMRSLPHGLFDARGPSVVVRAYRSGKVVIQGRAASDFVEMFLEPEILRKVRIGPEAAGNPEDDSPHAGSDECGKGDFFGPLVVAAAYVDPQTAPALRRLGVRDSKKIKSDMLAVRLGEEIRKAVRGRFAVVAIGPAKYNELYARFGNLNRLLAWAHAAALAEIARKVPSCARALVDQFAKDPVLEQAVKQQRLSLRVDQKPGAESDIAVAAASLLARAEFLRRLALLGKEAGRTLPKGASSPVLAAAREIVRSQGADRLRTLAKVHFRTFGRAAEHDDPQAAAAGGASEDKPLRRSCAGLPGKYDEAGPRASEHRPENRAADD